MVVVSLYYVNHKPFGMGFAVRVIRSVGQFFIASMIIILAGGLGNFIHKYFKQKVDEIIYPSIQTGLGLGCLAIGILIFNGLIGIKPLFIWGTCVISLIFLRKYVLSWLISHRGLLHIWEQSDLFGKLVFTGISIILLFTFFSALAPPIKFDALVYHLTLPERYIQNGKMLYLPENAYWGMPQLGEMLYTWGIALGGLETAAILGWMVTLLSLIGLFDFVCKNVAIRNGWIALATILSGFTLAISSSWAYIDWFAFLFGFGMLVSLVDWQKRNQKSSLILAAIFAGFGLSSKYTAGVLIVAGIFVILFIVFKSKYLANMPSNTEINSEKPISFIQMIRWGSLFCGIATIIFSPWLIKNWLETGQPFYPFLYPAGSMNQFRIDFYQGGALWGNLWESILLPLKATLEGVEGAPGYNASIGPFILCLAPLAFIGIKKLSQEQKTLISTAATISFVGLATWMVASRQAGLLIQTRLYLSIFPAFVVLSAIGFDSIRRINIDSIRVSRIFECFVLLVLWLNAIQVVQHIERSGAIQETLAIISSEEYLDKNLGWYSPTMKYVRQLPVNTKILMLWEARSLYCLPGCQPDELLDRWLTIRKRYGRSVDPQQLVADFKSEGFNYLLFYKTGADFIRESDSRYTPSDWTLLDQFLRLLPTPVSFGDVYFLYTLNG